MILSFVFLLILWRFGRGAICQAYTWIVLRTANVGAVSVCSAAQFFLGYGSKWGCFNADQSRKFSCPLGVAALCFSWLCLLDVVFVRELVIIHRI